MVKLKKQSLKATFQKELKEERAKSKDWAEHSNDALFGWLKRKWVYPVSVLLVIGATASVMHFNKEASTAKAANEKLSYKVADAKTELGQLKTVSDVKALKAEYEATKKTLDAKLKDFVDLQYHYRTIKFTTEEGAKDEASDKKKFEEFFDGNKESIWILKGQDWTMDFTTVDPYSYDTIRLVGQMKDSSGKVVGIYVMTYSKETKKFTEVSRYYDVEAMQNGAPAWMAKARNAHVAD